MRPVLLLAAALFPISSFAFAQTVDTSAVMCEQFAVNGASYTVEATTELSEDFVPAHHAPRNIPIEVALPDNVVSYIHFPIVEDGTYLVYATEPDRLIGLEEKNGTTIASSTIDAAQDCPDVLAGGLTADINLGTLMGPVPIAIEFSAGEASEIRLIVSRSPINPHSD
ncbi:MAG: hypothetical protein AAF414_16275 [Pseudomonadota bacterium]